MIPFSSELVVKLREEIARKMGFVAIITPFSDYREAKVVVEANKDWGVACYSNIW